MCIRLLTICFLVFSALATGNERTQVFVIDDELDSHQLEADLYFLEDPESKLTLEEARKQTFKRFYGNNLNFGFTDSAYWLYTDILNLSKYETLVVENKNSRIDQLDFFVIRADGSIEELASGDERSYYNRSYDIPFMNLSFDVPNGERVSLYIRAKSESALNLPLYISTVDSFINSTAFTQLISGMFYGAALALLIYNIFLYIYLREPAYFFYCMNVLMTMAFFASFDGYAFSLWPESFVLQQSASYIFAAMAAIFVLLFTRHYLDTRPFSVEETIIQYNLYANAAVLVAIGFLDNRSLSMLVTASSCLASVSVIVVSVMRLNAGYRPALHSILAWSCLATAILIASLGVFGLDVPFFASLTFMKVGFIAQLGILSVGLAYRINLMKQEKLVANQRADEAKQAGEQKLEFLARMSHEIRTPMNGILGIIQLLQDTDTDDQQADYLRTLKSSTDSLVDIINDILDYSKIQAGSLTLEVIPFELVKLVNECVSIFSVTLTEKQIRMAVNIANHLPPVVCGDPTRLKQILFNLLSNSVKFTDKGQIIISVEAEPPGYQLGDPSVKLRFVVEDTGSGIPEDKLDSIFDVFTQSESSVQRNYGGSGLGLAICKELTEAMGGEIGVDSSVEKGSKFWFSINLGVINERNQAAFQPKEDSSRSLQPSDFHGVHCLVVDDNQVNKMVLIRILTGLGAICTSASDGEEAVEAFNEQRESIDIVFMDCEMPGLDGYAAAETIRELEGNYLSSREPVPIIAITAHVQDEYKQKCFAAGMNEHLPKPIAKEKIIETLQRWAPHVEQIDSDTVRH